MIGYQQTIVNIMSFEVAGLSHLDSPMSNMDLTAPRQVILNLNGLKEDTKSQKVFISIEKNKDGNCISYYKKKYYWDTSTIAEYLAAVMDK